jgi:hypothetical protein
MPENILLHDGEALLTDVGIAIAPTAAGGERLTETGLSIGRLGAIRYCFTIFVAFSWNV